MDISKVKVKKEDVDDEEEKAYSSPLSMNINEEQPDDIPSAAVAFASTDTDAAAKAPSAAPAPLTMTNVRIKLEDDDDIDKNKEEYLSDENSVKDNGALPESVHTSYKEYPLFKDLYNPRKVVRQGSLRDFLRLHEYHNETLQEPTVQLQERVTEDEPSFQEDERKVGDAKAKFDELQQKYDDAKSKIEELQQECGRLTAEKNKLKEDHDVAVKDSRSFQADFDEAWEAKNEKAGIITELRSEMKRADETNTRLAAENDRYEKKIENLQEQLVVAQKQLEENKQVMSELRESNTDQANSLKRLQTEKVSICEKHQKEKNALLERLESEQKKNGELQRMEAASKEPGKLNLTQGRDEPAAGTKPSASVSSKSATIDQDSQLAGMKRKTGGGSGGGEEAHFVRQQESIPLATERKAPEDSSEDLLRDEIKAYKSLQGDNDVSSEALTGAVEGDGLNSSSKVSNLTYEDKSDVRGRGKGVTAKTEHETRLLQGKRRKTGGSENEASVQLNASQQETRPNKRSSTCSVYIQSRGNVEIREFYHRNPRAPESLEKGDICTLASKNNVDGFNKLIRIVDIIDCDYTVHVRYHYVERVENYKNICEELEAKLKGQKDGTLHPSYPKLTVSIDNGEIRTAECGVFLKSLSMVTGRFLDVNKKAEERAKDGKPCPEMPQPSFSVSELPKPGFAGYRKGVVVYVTEKNGETPVNIEKKIPRVPLNKLIEYIKGCVQGPLVAETELPPSTVIILPAFVKGRPVISKVPW